MHVYHVSTERLVAGYKFLEIYTNFHIMLKNVLIFY